MSTRATLLPRTYIDRFVSTRMGWNKTEITVQKSSSQVEQVAGPARTQVTVGSFYLLALWNSVEFSRTFGNNLRLDFLTGPVANARTTVPRSVRTDSTGSSFWPKDYTTVPKENTTLFTKMLPKPINFLDATYTSNERSLNRTYSFQRITAVFSRLLFTLLYASIGLFLRLTTIYSCTSLYEGGNRAKFTFRNRNYHSRRTDGFLTHRKYSGTFSASISGTLFATLASLLCIVFVIFHT